MKAAYIEQVGCVDNIIVGELPQPKVMPHDVLVKVTYTTVNHVDCYIRSGKYPLALPLPYILGRDFCGEVVQVGSDVKQFKVGDKVWSHCQGIDGRQGTFAEFLAVNEQSIFPLPNHVDPREAIAVFHSAFTALLGLQREAQLKAQETLFVHGAAGNIGAMVIQIAKAFGAKVIASTHGQDKIDYCHSLGADAVLDYKTDFTKQLKELAPKGIDVFWNTSRHHDFKASLPLMALKGRYILMAGSGTEAVLPIGDLYIRDGSIRGFTISNARDAEIRQSATEINNLLSQGHIKAKIERTLSLDDVKMAHQLMEKGESWGKMVVKVAH